MGVGSLKTVVMEHDEACHIHMYANLILNIESLQHTNLSLTL